MSFLDVLGLLLGIVVIVVPLFILGMGYWCIISTNSILPLKEIKKGRLAKALLFLIIFTPIIFICSSCSILRNVYEEAFAYNKPKTFYDYFFYGVAYVERLIPRIEFLGNYFPYKNSNISNILPIILAEVIKIVLIIIYNFSIKRILNLKKAFEESDNKSREYDKKRNEARPKEYAWFRGKKGYVLAEVDNDEKTISTSFWRILNYYVCFTVLPFVSSVIFIGEFIIKNIIAVVKSK